MSSCRQGTVHDWFDRPLPKIGLRNADEPASWNSAGSMSMVDESELCELTLIQRALQQLYA